MGALFTPVYLFLLPSVDLQKDIPLSQRLLQKIDWLGNLFCIGTICCFTLAITFGGSVFSWSSASEITLWVMAGVLFLVFGLSQAFHPLIDAQYKLYPTMFLRQPLMVMLQLSIFMSSVSLLVGHVFGVLECLLEALLNTVPDPSILYTTPLSIRSGKCLPSPSPPPPPPFYSQDINST